AHATPGADGEPVGDAVVQAQTEEDIAAILVEQREADVRRDLEALLAIQAELADGGCASERAGDVHLRLRLFGHREHGCHREHGGEEVPAQLGKDRGFHRLLTLSSEDSRHVAHFAPPAVSAPALGRRYLNENGMNTDTPSCAWTLLVREVSPSQVSGSARSAGVAAT